MCVCVCVCVCSVSTHNSVTDLLMFYFSSFNFLGYVIKKNFFFTHFYKYLLVLKYLFICAFDCCLNVVLLLDKELYPKNSHIVFCPNKLHYFEPLCVWILYS